MFRLIINCVSYPEFCNERGGSLVDESNPALQGFLSWELWRRHRGDPSGQYWLGAQRDALDPKNWKWISGKTVTVSRGLRQVQRDLESFLGKNIVYDC